MIKISDEIKAKIVIEADTSGADEAAAALEKLQGMAGDGSLGDALAEQFAAGTKGAEEFAGAVDAVEEPLKSGEEAVSNLNDALEEHQQVAQDAATAQEAFSGQVVTTANQLKEVPTSLDAVTKSTQAMSEQVAKSGDNFAGLSDNMTNLRYANEGVASWWSDSMLAATEKTYSVLGSTAPTNFVPETLWNVGEQARVASDAFSGMTVSASDAGQAVYDFLGLQSNGDSGFVPETLWNANDAAKAATESITSTNQSFAAIGPSAADANKAVSEFFGSTNTAAEKTGGIFSNIFGEGSVFGRVSEGVGGFFGGIGDTVGGLMMGLNEIAMPLMAVQMLGQMASSAGSWIYNANLAAEGPNAAQPYSYTTQASLFGGDFTRGLDQIAVGIGQGLLPAIEGANAAQQNGSGGADTWKGIGNAIGGAFGLFGSGIAEISGAGAMGLGSIISLFGGNGSSIFNAGQNWFSSGGEAGANLIAQMLGQPLPFKPTVASVMYAGQDPNAAWAQSHYTGTTGPNDPMGAYEQEVALNTAGYPTPYDIAPTPDIGDDWNYFRFLPSHGVPGSAYAIPGSGFAAAPGQGYTTSDVQSQLYQGTPNNWGGAIGDFISGGNPGTIRAGNTVGDSIDSLFGGIGNSLHNLIFGSGGGEGMGVGGSFADSGGCFVAGTRVLLADGTERPIEQLQVDDKVVGYDGRKTIPATIQACITFLHKQTYKLTFSDGRTLVLTDSHPLYSPDAGWRSLSPAMTKEESPDLPVSQLEIGDGIATVDGTCTLVAVEKRDITQVFNVTVDGTHTYYANGVLTHNIKAGNLGGGAQSIGSGGEFHWPAMPEIKWPSLPEIKWPSLPEIKWPSLPEIKWPSLPEIKWPSLPEIKWPSLPEIKWPSLPEIKWPSLPEIKWPSLPEIKWPALPEIHWPSLPTISWPALPTIQWPSLPTFTWPSLPTITWPSLPTITWPSLPSFSWPSLPEIKWPSLPEFKWPTLPEFHWPSFPEFHWPPMPSITISSFGIPGFASGVQNFQPGGASGIALVGESGPELVMLPSGSSVYPMLTGGGVGGNGGSVSLGGGGGVQTANISVYLDSQTLISLMGASLQSSINVGLGKRSY